ncbi:TPA: phenylacetic acid degradation protein PaaN [Pseudomonas aeruginosa]|uniref:phenylacetic acid degradation protein PaaN n=1 Tax=Pseudomonas aeruginosa TaxID=287 RepID=UPI001A301F5A|nr:phenylacetic acid degradation protein PaaN [Pseudomonas aeruginosa]MBH9459180.1 phenylacetic acid degradation protein PaaN [Pseudomonas aeruginosa]HCF9525667.1 phenylacetic acid degradation protein PaaN [Pseudomonas aeruginosa]HCF9565388.1 phenylacetic acid degradation protein PaaN [Pseudomonas aeruginosa]HCL3826799.1 phenylacetic acid degradation protein PaaN [Pseudomonas aeruginosa]HEK0948922.1 phenylacetic acid degradation protein PaaN [Pseudomonas aeruginosa]
MSLISKRGELLAAHAPLIAEAVRVVQSRESWSPFQDSPSTKIHGTEKPVAGKAAFESRLGQPYVLDQPGIVNWLGEEVSPYTQEHLGITYPISSPEALIASASEAQADWAQADFQLRAALCVEMAQRLYACNFEMAHAIMHTTGQSYTQAFSGSGPNALDRGIEALAHAVKAMAAVQPEAHYSRTFGREQVNLHKRYKLVPRGIGLVICCASFPTWNAYPAIFASLATGNPVIVKPHPIAVLPMALVVSACREVLVDYGFSPDLVTLAVDTREQPVAGRFIEHPAVQIIDFTGSPRYGHELENSVTNKLLFTETAGVNSVVVESVDSLEKAMRAVARASSLFSAQMCTSPQVIYVPAAGIATADGHASFEQVAQALVAEIDAIANDPASAAGIMGAVQGQVSLDVVAELQQAVAQLGLRVLREARPYAHEQFPRARTLTPLVVAVDPSHVELYAEERFGPVLFVVAVSDARAAVQEATELARSRGSISSYMYSHDEAFIDWALPHYERAGANLTINLTGPMWINFAAAYSDYHVSGLNPAGNACLADAAFVASRFRIVQQRRPVEVGA